MSQLDELIDSGTIALREFLEDPGPAGPDLNRLEVKTLLDELGKLGPMVTVIHQLLEAPEFADEVSIYTARVIQRARALVESPE